MKKVRDIGIDAKHPENECESVKCPWHGSLKTRGRIFKGTVNSSKPSETSVITLDYFNYIKKYERYERKSTRICVHNPSCISAKKGDVVRVMECRPLSKSKRFVIVEKLGKETTKMTEDVKTQKEKTQEKSGGKK